MRRRLPSAICHWYGVLRRLNWRRNLDQLDGKAVVSKFSLSSTSLFSDLPSDRLELLEQDCNWRSFDANETIIKYGEELTNVFVIYGGETHVMNYSENGKAVDYATLKSGDIFGEFAAIDGLPRSAWVIAKSPSTIAVLPGELFIKTFTEHPASALKLMRRLSFIIRQSNEHLRDVSLLSAEQRISLELMRLTGSDGENGDVSVIHNIPNHSDIGNVVGLTRETVARVLSKLSQEEIVQRQGRTLHILDRQRLQNLAIP